MPPEDNSSHEEDSGATESGADPFELPADREFRPRGRSKALSVTELTRRVRRLLESEIGTVAVEGEISNWRPAASGHVYFVLKDEQASIRCVMFRNVAMRLKFQPSDGMQVEVRGRLSVYEARGEYQIIVDSIAEQGMGALFEAFVRLKEKLEKEGLFDPERKQPLPFLPRRIGVVTSPTGAAIRDMLNVLGRRFANLQVLIWPVRVQGEGAGAEVAHALRELDRRKLADVIICGRGGGSIEDLWAFNEEVVARAIHRCKTPIISAVGHEIDFTIADFVADLRAPTPSAAAELVTASQVELQEKLRSLGVRLDQAVIPRVRYLRSQLEGLLQSYALEEPRYRLRQLQQRTDDLIARLDGHVAHALKLGSQQVAAHTGRLAASVRAAMRATATTVTDRLGRLDRAVAANTDRARTRLDGLGERLELLGPQATLERGYSIVTRRQTGEIVRSPKQVTMNDPLDIETAGGRLPALATPPPKSHQADLFET